MQWAGLIVGVLSLITIVAGARNELRRRSRIRRQVAENAARWKQLQTRATSALVAESSPGWTGLRTFVVERKTVESDGVVSVYLTAEDGRPLPSFRPGQFITLELPVRDEARPIKRCYSLSHAPGEQFYRITVKEVPNGLGSGFVHRTLEVGTTVNVRAPAGRFVVDTDSLKPVVLVAGGIGVTPFLSMLNCHAELRDRTVILLYSVRNGREHVGKQELSELNRRHTSLRIITIYTAPNDTDSHGVDFEETRRVDIESIRQAVPTLDADFYICGSAEMTANITDQLTNEGVERAAIRSEGFGGRPTAKRRDLVSTGENRSESDSADSKRLRVTFEVSGKVVEFDDDRETLLELAERHGVDIESSCRSGNCGTCQIGLIKGTVDAIDGSDMASENGHCLPCIAQPSSDIVLNA